MDSFQKELESLINKHSKEIESNTPDFILADFLQRCLDAFNNCIKTRDNWYDKSETALLNRVDEDEKK